MHHAKKKLPVSILKAPIASNVSNIFVDEDKVNNNQQHPFIHGPTSVGNNDNDFAGNISDVSAVYEDVEAWVKSVYRVDDEKNATNIQLMTVGRSADYVENTDKQQAEEDEAFLDAILKDS